MSILHSETCSRQRNELLHRRCVCCYLNLPDSSDRKYDDGQGQRQRKLRQIEEEVMIKVCGLCESDIGTVCLSVMETTCLQDLWVFDGCHSLSLSFPQPFCPLLPPPICTACFLNPSVTHSPRRTKSALIPSFSPFCLETDHSTQKKSFQHIIVVKYQTHISNSDFFFFCPHQGRYLLEGFCLPSRC